MYVYLLQRQKKGVFILYCMVSSQNVCCDVLLKNFVHNAYFGNNLLNHIDFGCLLLGMI